LMLNKTFNDFKSSATAFTARKTCFAEKTKTFECNPCDTDDKTPLKFNHSQMPSIKSRTYFSEL
jgi:hypothetical protein